MTITEFNLSNLRVTIHNHKKSLDVFYGEPYEYFLYDLTNLHDFTTEENIDDLIEVLQNKADIQFNKEDITKLHEELQPILYPHSSEINS